MPNYTRGAHNYSSEANSGSSTRYIIQTAPYIRVCVQTRENPNPIQDERRLLQHTMFKRQFLSNNSAVCIHFSPLSQLLVYNTHWGKNPHFIQKITFLKSHF